MTVKRIVIDIPSPSVAEVKAFYEDLFGLQTVMDQGWIVTLSSGESMPVQISIASEGGSGQPVPDVSIEVDDAAKLHARAQAQGHEIVYDLTEEPWGVLRFFIRDPAGKLLNILSHL